MASKLYFQNGLFIVFFIKYRHQKDEQFMQVELFLDKSCLNSCELLMMETKTNFPCYCFKEISYNMKVRVSTVLETPGTNEL